MAAPEQSPETPAGALRPPPEPGAIVLVIGGPIARANVPGLCARARALLEGSGAGLIICDVGPLVDADAVTVDALARLALTARRLGRQARVRRASCELRELLALVGLCEVLPVRAGLRLGPRGQAEEREQARGVEERVDPDDPAG